MKVPGSYRDMPYCVIELIQEFCDSRGPQRYYESLTEKQIAGLFRHATRNAQDELDELKLAREKYNIPELTY